jgi:Fe-S cluster assembly ATP-binding protein
MLTITDLTVEIDNKTIINGLSLSVPSGEVHAIMGPNGAGKSTLSYALTGRAGYEVTGGSATLDGTDLLTLEPEERAAHGLFLSFQYPLEIPGVPTLTFLRTAVNAQRKARGEAEMSVPEFMKLSREVAKKLGVTPDMMRKSGWRFTRWHFWPLDL